MVCKRCGKRTTGFLAVQTRARVYHGAVGRSTLIGQEVLISFPVTEAPRQVTRSGYVTIVTARSWGRHANGFLKSVSAVKANGRSLQFK